MGGLLMPCWVANELERRQSHDYHAKRPWTNGERKVAALADPPCRPRTRPALAVKAGNRKTPDAGHVVLGVGGAVNGSTS